jgi:hypothetical protein
MSELLYDMFSTADAAQQVAKLENYKTAMNKAIGDRDAGRNGYNPETRTMIDRSGGIDLLERIGTIEKAVGAEAVEGLSQQLAELRAAVGTINKDWTPSSPVGGTGLTPYDLEAPAKVLVPRETPLRNSLPRIKGQGNARKFKRILSFSNAGVPGGAANVSPFFSSSTQTSTWGGPGNLTLNRPAKISYTGDDQSVGYVELGLSDSVTWQTQFQGLGFDDVRGLSHTALLWAHLQGEERGILYGRGATTIGYSGIVAAPSGVTTGTATTGGTLAALTYYVYVAAVTGFGQSAVSTVVSQATTGATSTVTVTIGTEPVGALYYNLYVGTTTGIANATLQTAFSGNTYTFTSYSVTATTTLGTDSSFSAQSYDGFLTVQSDPTKTGYLKRVNGAWSTTTPGTEIDTALTNMYVNNGAEPSEVWMTGAMMKAYSQLMRIGGVNGAASGYRTNVVAGDNGITIGAAVTAQVNPATQGTISLKVHRFMPLGCALIRSTRIPVPDSRVGAPVNMVNVQDYMAVDWPNIQMTYDTSTYQIGTMEHIAPAWSGLLLGVTNS